MPFVRPALYPPPYPSSPRCQAAHDDSSSDEDDDDDDDDGPKYVEHNGFYKVT